VARIFINYRRQDSEGYAGRLYDHLLRHFDAEQVFMDVDSIPPGVDFVTFLDDAIAQCDVLLAVMGAQWEDVCESDGTRRLMLETDFVRVEIASALRQKKIVIPVLVGGGKMPSTANLPDDLKPLLRRNSFEVKHAQFAADVDRLADAIRRVASPKPLLTSAERAEKEAALKAIRLDLMNATDSPLYELRQAKRHFPVLGDGNPDASLLFISEAPGVNEAKEGRPFFGQAGAVLNEMLDSIGLHREDVYVTNFVLDYLGAKREPTREEIAYYAPFVDRVLDVVRPTVIVAMGGTAARVLLTRFDQPEARDKISQIHGKLMPVEAPWGGALHIVPTYHPAAVLYSASWKAWLREDFQKLRMFV
jgi:uracil-DNA glycosylase family 4